MVKEDVADKSVNFEQDAAAINEGLAQKVDNTYQVNGRIYGHHDGMLYPISGQGLYQLDRGAYKALEILNDFGTSDKVKMIFERMGMTGDAIKKAMEVYHKINPATK